MVIFGVSGFVMVVVSLFTKKIPREELDGLTWSTINEPPISHGAIGEEAENESVENEDIRVTYNVRKTKRGSRGTLLGKPIPLSFWTKVRLHELSRLLSVKMLFGLIINNNELCLLGSLVSHFRAVI